MVSLGKNREEYILDHFPSSPLCKRGIHKCRFLEKRLKKKQKQKHRPSNYHDGVRLFRENKLSKKKIFNTKKQKNDGSFFSFSDSSLQRFGIEKKKKKSKINLLY